ncbi:MAG: hypothetical protein CSB23_02845 [Deltaproteobacteria bacterium]|nr:MAG: hypothetical protein CSB23_02845 [Deltaproteobacteria bacterium]
MLKQQPVIDESIACPNCDLLLPRTETRKGFSRLCPRCGKKLSPRKSQSIKRCLALALAGILLYFPAVLLPLISFEKLGFSGSANVVESIVNFYKNGYYFVAGMSFLSALLLPFLILLSSLLVSLGLYYNRRPSWLRFCFRSYLHLEEWAMLEVYLLAIMVTIIKMADSSTVIYHIGVGIYAALVLIIIAISTAIDKEEFWSRLEEKAPDTPLPTQATTLSEQDSALDYGLIQCHTCHKLIPVSEDGKPCPRCLARLFKRIPGSRQKTWALLIASLIFIVPANILPIMEVRFLGTPEKSTIFDGILYFFQHGSALIGLVIFTASILVPLFKILGIGILLLTSPPCALPLLRQKTALYRVIIFIGRWSMLDVFVIALLISLVDFGFLSTVNAGPAATFFCMVVVLTMLAATTYDPRLMWDRCYRGKTPAPSTPSNATKRQ